MIGTGTIINVFAVIIAGIIGKLFGRFVKKKYQEPIIRAIGVSVIFIGASGALEKMFTVDNGVVSTGGSVLIIISMVLGTLIGEFIDIQGKIEKFGEWLKKKSGNEKDGSFVEGFVTASFTVCIGAMAIVGSIEDGLHGDYSILAAKSILDFIVIILMTASMGVGCVFSAIPVAALQGGVTVFAKFLEPVMTTAVLNNISLVGSVLIFCVGLNMVRPNSVKVANMLPALLIAALLIFVPGI